MQRLLVVVLCFALTEAISEPKVNAVLSVTVREMNPSPSPTGPKPAHYSYTASVGYCSRKARCGLLPGATNTTRVYGGPTTRAPVAVVFAYTKRKMGSLYVELSVQGERYGPKRVDLEYVKPSLVAHGLEMYFLQEVTLNPTVFQCLPCVGVPVH